MIIPINEQYRIELDRFSWAISGYAPRKDKRRKQWRQEAWFRTLNQAAEAARDRLLDESDPQQLDQVIAAVHASTNLIAASIERSGIPDSWLEAKKTSGGDL